MRRTDREVISRSLFPERGQGGLLLLFFFKGREGVTGVDEKTAQPVRKFTMTRLSARHCKRPYRSPAHILSTTCSILH